MSQTHCYTFVRLSLGLFCLSLPFFSCAPDFKDISTPNGRRAVIEQAQNFLTAGNCESAISVLQPVMSPPYVDDEIRMVSASAYACKGGFAITGIIGALIDTSGSDIWSAFVRSDYSKDSSDGHLEALQSAAELVRSASPYKDASNGNHYEAVYRSAENNLYMIFLQTTIVATIIARSHVGKAYSASGKKSVAISGRGTSSDQCAIQVAIATITNSLSYASGGDNLTKVGSSINSICGGNCVTNLNPSYCTAKEMAEGQAYIIAIDSQWNMGP